MPILTIRYVRSHKEYFLDCCFLLKTGSSSIYYIKKSIIILLLIIIIITTTLKTINHIIGLIAIFRVQKNLCRRKEDEEEEELIEVRACERTNE